VREERLSGETAAAVAKLARRSGTTPFMVLLAGFQAVLARWSGQRDVSVGTPIAGRNLVEIEELIGFFVNTLVMRTGLGGNPAFSELLARVRTTALEAYAHHQVPFEKLVEELSPERALGSSPLFQVMFTLQNAPVDSIEVEGLTLRPLEIAGDGAPFDLSLAFEEVQGELAGTLVYDADLFDASTAERLGGSFARLIEAAAAQPSRRLSELPLLSGCELSQMLVEWNDTGFPHPYEVCLHELFRRQAARTPEAVAVSCEGRRMSYAELDRSSDRLAGRLAALGVGPEVRVGLCMERSIELVVSLLGVLKAGGAYVPLDPEYPRERLAAMLEDACAAVVLTQEALLAGLPETPAAVLALDPDLRVLDGVPGGGPARPATPGNLAYVLFTSGSTGRPKGVMIPHAAISHHMLWMQSRYPLAESDCVLQKTAISFDASVWEFYAPLLAGARLAVAPAGEQRDPARLVERLRAEGVTVLQVVPTLLQMLLHEPGFGDCRGLRRVCCGGEQLTEELRRSLLDRLPGATLVNLYGPAEATINASSRELPPGVAAEISIGTPIHNARLYVVGADLEPVPRGAMGELLVGGPGVGRGYLGRPDLTAERFIPDPFGPSGERLYRTGDLCRFLPMGEVEFLGRIDHQVKLRGFRVELGEIEAVLRARGVREAVALVREERLVAYVVPEEGSPPVPELREALRRTLPEYMVPSAWVTLESLPLSPNGKVDRQALPAPEAG
ncbi:MAG TPA: amino acid adenylation domain-containing protein, partial [Thermoanaerobaculia bacterium]|nr:amino acid adenylation domain-containing protein [Thermoanaerobaculia bacterium]